jgi:hypothetical protein
MLVVVAGRCLTIRLPEMVVLAAVVKEGGQPFLVRLA